VPDYVTIKDEILNYHNKIVVFQQYSYPIIIGYQ